MLITDRDEMYNLYRGPSIDASYQVSASGFRGKGFRKSTNKIKELSVEAIFVNASGRKNLP
jgi:hypothetical protein